MPLASCYFFLQLKGRLNTNIAKMLVFAEFLWQIEMVDSVERVVTTTSHWAENR